MAQPVYPNHKVGFQRQQLTSLINEVNGLSFFGPVQSDSGTLTPNQKGEAINIQGVSPVSTEVNSPTRTLSISILNGDGAFEIDDVIINESLVILSGANNPTEGAVWTSTGTTGAGEWRVSGTNSFAGLDDTPLVSTPNPFTNYAGNLIFINPSETALEYTDLIKIDVTNSKVDITEANITDLEVTNLVVGGGSGLTFIGLNDTPGSFPGTPGRVPSVNPAMDALIFSDYFAINPSRQETAHTATPHDRIDIGFSPLEEPIWASTNEYGRNGINFNFSGSDEASFPTIAFNISCTYSKPSGFAGEIIGQRIFLTPKAMGPNAPAFDDAENVGAVGLDMVIGSRIFDPTTNATPQSGGSIRAYRAQSRMWRNAPSASVYGIDSEVMVDNGYSSAQSGSDAQCSNVRGIYNVVTTDLCDVGGDVSTFHSISNVGATSSGDQSRSRIQGDWVGASFDVATNWFVSLGDLKSMVIEGLNLSSGRVDTTSAGSIRHIESTGRALSTFDGPIEIANLAWGDSNYDDGSKTPSSSAPLALSNGSASSSVSNRTMIDFDCALGAVGSTTESGKIRIRVGGTEYALMVYPIS